MKKFLCIIQARMGSTRLPGKVLFKVGKLTMLEFLIQRVSYSQKIDKIVVATGDIPKNKKIENICNKIKIPCFKGSESDVLDRYYQCFLKNSGFQYIIRLTADNPLVDPCVIDEIIEFVEKNPQYDYVSNNIERTFPYGLDVEIFKKEVLIESAQKSKLASEREHVTVYMKNNSKFKKKNIAADFDFSHFRLTVDYENDFRVIKFLIKNSKIDDKYFKYISLLTKKTELMFLNRNVV